MKTHSARKHIFFHFEHILLLNIQLIYSPLAHRMKYLKYGTNVCQILLKCVKIG